MTITGPDVSGFQSGLTLQPGTAFAAAKATEGTGFTDVTYTDFKGQAARVGALFWAYHFLHQGDPGGQAAHAYAVVGKTPLMLDWEPTGASVPGVADAAGFIDAYRSLGGRVWAAYLPHWYWQQIGSPSLAPIAQRALVLVSSNYTAYSDTGPGWAAYGGMAPSLWQYTDAQPYGGQHVDFNAFRGTRAELEALVTGQPPTPAPVPTLPKENEMILHAITGSTEVWALSGDLYWHVADPASLQSYRDAGVQVATVSGAEHGDVLAAVAALKQAPATVQVDAAQLGAAIAAGLHLPAAPTKFTGTLS
jgi:hypothetical protein